MRRRDKQEPHENHERWLVSYADFITLMFAFFVVMFAASRADQGKAQQISNSVERALQEGVAKRIRTMMTGVPSPASRPVPIAKPEQFAELLPSLQKLTNELRQEIADGKLQITLEPRGLVISMKEAAFFPSGDATLSVDTHPIIEKVAATLRRLPNSVRLEGHTDARPINNYRFRSNWELSAARSIAMLEILNRRFQIPAERMAIVGYGETIALDTNETEEGRARNRRVDITILNQAAAIGEARSRSS